MHPDWFHTLKYLHILFFVIFIGNTSLGLLLKRSADRTRDPKVMAHVLGEIVWSDRWISVPAAVALVLSGIASAKIVGLSVLGTAWIWQSALLLTLSGALYSLSIGPLQRRMHVLCANAASGAGFDATRYRAMSLAWYAMGTIALLLPLAAGWLMVGKNT